MNENAGRIILVTGAAKGIGRALSLALFKQGHVIAAVDQDDVGLARLCDDATKMTGRMMETFSFDLNVADPSPVIERVSSRVGRIEVLINNAGIGQGQVKPDYHLRPPRFHDVSGSQWQLAMAVNANAVFHLSRAVVPSMIKKGWGRIINITTSLGTMLRPGYAPYGPTKAAAEALSAIMAGDLEGTGVTVNVVVPGGIVNTPMIPAESPYNRNELLQSEVMFCPVSYLISTEADAVNGLRFLGNKWREDMTPTDAVKIAAAPIGWADLAVLPVAPGVRA